jgi:hypothetical protein
MSGMTAINGTLFEQMTRYSMKTGGTSTSSQKDNLFCRHVEQFMPILSVMFPAAEVIKERKKYRLNPSAMLFNTFCTVMCKRAFCIFTDLSQKSDRDQDFASGIISPSSL